jgi:hypothetical protein
MCIHELDLTRWFFFTFQHFLLEQIDSNEQLRALRDLPSDLADVSAAAKVSDSDPAAVLVRVDPAPVGRVMRDYLEHWRLRMSVLYKGCRFPQTYDRWTRTIVDDGRDIAHGLIPRVHCATCSRAPVRDSVIQHNSLTHSATNPLLASLRNEQQHRAHILVRHSHHTDGPPTMSYR